jgi:hypothetical protein
MLKQVIYKVTTVTRERCGTLFVNLALSEVGSVGATTHELRCGHTTLEEQGKVRYNSCILSGGFSCDVTATHLLRNIRAEIELQGAAIRAT